MRGIVGALLAFFFLSAIVAAVSSYQQAAPPLNIYRTINATMNISAGNQSAAAVNVSRAVNLTVQPAAPATTAVAGNASQANQTGWAPDSGTAIASGTSIGTAIAVTAAHSIATDAYSSNRVSVSRISAGASVVTLPDNITAITIAPAVAGRIITGPVMLDAFKDDDNDGVMNSLDQCPNTPPGALVYDNGCRCIDSNPGGDIYVKNIVDYREKVPNLLSGGNGKNKSGIDYSITNYEAESKCGTAQWSTWADDTRCNPDYETGKSDQAVLSSTAAIYCNFGCKDGACRRPQACSTLGGGNCSDGIKNQDETGVDCGGKCPPCASTCVTGAKYAPSDTPCTSVNGLDPYTVNMTWTNSTDYNHICWWYEVCHKDLDFVIEEATKCCSAQTEEEVASMPDRYLCKDALNLGGDNCQKCVGMYIVKGMGTYARWMQGYQELDTLYTNPHPTAETLINHYKIGVCRDYALATATLLRKAGYAQDDVGSYCDGAHCWDVVRFPGDSKWTVVDTTGNYADVHPGGLPSKNYDYCHSLNESNLCFLVNGYYTRPIADVNAYWSIVGSGGTYDYPKATQCNITYYIPPGSGPGVAGGRDSFRIPDFAPSVKDIVGCG